MLKLKRIYEPYDVTDGYRILVDRLWPRGIKKEIAHISLWAKEVAPSPALRIWFNHEPEKWEAFYKAYSEELEHAIALTTLIEKIADEPIVTLVYAAKDKEHTHALVLFDIIKLRLKV